MDLTRAKTADLKKELDRRQKKHHLRVGGTVFDLTEEELEVIRDQIDKILPPAQAFTDLWEKFVKRDVPAPTPWPWTTPAYPGNPWKSPTVHPDYEPIIVTCQAQK